MVFPSTDIRTRGRLMSLLEQPSHWEWFYSLNWYEWAESRIWRTDLGQEAMLVPRGFLYLVVRSSHYNHGRLQHILRHSSRYVHRFYTLSLPHRSLQLLLATLSLHMPLGSNWFLASQSRVYVCAFDCFLRILRWWLASFQALQWKEELVFHSSTAVSECNAVWSLLLILSSGTRQGKRGLNSQQEDQHIGMLECGFIRYVSLFLPFTMYQ